MSCTTTWRRVCGGRCCWRWASSYSSPTSCSPSTTSRQPPAHTSSRTSSSNNFFYNFTCTVGFLCTFPYQSSYLELQYGILNEHHRLPGKGHNIVDRCSSFFLQTFIFLICIVLWNLSNPHTLNFKNFLIHKLNNSTSKIKVLLSQKSEILYRKDKYGQKSKHFICKVVQSIIYCLIFVFYGV